MEITSIRIKKNHIGGTTLGTASVQLDNCLVIHDIKLVENNGKRILSFPNKKTKKYVMENGEYSEVNSYMDIIHPSNKEFREYIETEIFKVYDNELKGEEDE
jgi:DNA-binding cell septation regulator SpoVG